MSDKEVLDPNDILASYCPGDGEEAFLALMGMDNSRTAAIHELVKSFFAQLSAEGRLERHHVAVAMGEVYGPVQVLIMIEPEAAQSELVTLIADECGMELGCRPEISPIQRYHETRPDLRMLMSRLILNGSH